MLRRFREVIVKPVGFMENRQFEDHSWFPIAIVAIGVICLKILLLPELRAEYASEDFRQWYMERQQVTEEKARAEIARMSEFAPWMSLIEGPIMVTAGAAGVALFLYLIGRIGYKAKRSFVTLFNMTAWASAVSVFPILLQVLMVWLGVGGDGLPTNIAYYLPEEMKETYFYNFIQTLDLFLIWQVGLLGIGMSTIYEISLQRSITNVGTLFVVMAALNAGATSMLAVVQ